MKSPDSFDAEGKIRALETSPVPRERSSSRKRKKVAAEAVSSKPVENVDMAGLQQAIEANRFSERSVDDASAELASKVGELVDQAFKEPAFLEELVDRKGSNIGRIKKEANIIPAEPSEQTEQLRKPDEGEKPRKIATRSSGRAVPRQVAVGQKKEIPRKKKIIFSSRKGTNTLQVTPEDRGVTKRAVEFAESAHITLPREVARRQRVRKEIPIEVSESPAVEVPITQVRPAEEVVQAESVAVQQQNQNVVEQRAREEASIEAGKENETVSFGGGDTITIVGSGAESSVPATPEEVSTPVIEPEEAVFEDSIPNIPHVISFAELFAYLKGFREVGSAEAGTYMTSGEVIEAINRLRAGDPLSDMDVIPDVGNLREKVTRLLKEERERKKIIETLKKDLYPTPPLLREEARTTNIVRDTPTPLSFTIKAEKNTASRTKRFLTALDRGLLWLAEKGKNVAPKIFSRKVIQSTAAASILASSTLSGAEVENTPRLEVTPPQAVALSVPKPMSATTVEKATASSGQRISILTETPATTDAGNTTPEVSRGTSPTYEQKDWSKVNPEKAAVARANIEAAKVRGEQVWPGAGTTVSSNYTPRVTFPGSDVGKYNAPNSSASPEKLAPKKKSFARDLLNSFVGNQLPARDREGGEPSVVQDIGRAFVEASTKENPNKKNPDYPYRRSR